MVVEHRESLSLESSDDRPSDEIRLDPSLIAISSTNKFVPLCISLTNPNSHCSKSSLNSPPIPTFLPTTAINNSSPTLFKFCTLTGD